ncbi:proline dehydrogenase family protein [Weeksella virosa]|uniref:Proline dehydrogenase n=1 Tax=Weeksella virosa (strain ATCC 43766 / DSM 16922 / JCM 21250 / CCUG 30538 / CDC 9751 / IAM 14551 / NBRC 16016 / NCTC 11634 / CL345/78) TaxID=865938 RepID=F0NYJ2_WEEVC|nr:proline dehydrogenase family protein [Weeksella virosa]ADX67112.1 Proline dehydrogenase [Weeksella virosa DSM 16922]MDK7676259.1 proline dehydrogenase family protein [Weeksella virosa]SUP53383.1 bifunctional proline dehydrogenase/pyrroline-5-carboxylate dehydrogenase [Weeksella virosa]VEH63151.1 bifunctional proline dehydrogenase/pyrroline-5-carboxylate dehydrogenase [Weeksella virosa]
MSLFDNTEYAFQVKSDQELKKAHLLFKLIGNEGLTKLGGKIFNIAPFLVSFPMVKPLIRKTIYSQFVGGETPQEAIKVANELYRYHVSSILDYSVEGQTEESDFDHVRDVMLELIDISKNNPSIPFVVFKPTAFGRIELWEKVGKKTQLNPEETKAWENTRKRFEDVCEKGYQLDVNIMIDAEETWMQDAADDLCDVMMMKYNQKRPVIWNTLQMYRHDRLAYLKTMYEKAQKDNYFLGYKIVRGAYMEKERERAQAEAYPSPIQPNKEASDRDYDLALEFIASHHERFGLFAGTHNEGSCELLAKLMNENGIEKNNPNFWFGQLFGMSDNISFNLAHLGYNIAKYLPYGPIKEVMPYLIRRAQENTSVAGQTGRELMLIEKELERRKKIK